MSTTMFLGIVSFFILGVGALFVNQATIGVYLAACALWFICLARIAQADRHEDARK